MFMLIITLSTIILSMPLTLALIMFVGRYLGNEQVIRTKNNRCACGEYCRKGCNREAWLATTMPSRGITKEVIMAALVCLDLNDLIILG